MDITGILCLVRILLIGIVIDLSPSTIGMGAILLNGARVGKHCIVGAGALVTGKLDAPDGTLVLGNPAKVVRPLTPEEIAGLRPGAEHYRELREEYR